MSTAITFDSLKFVNRLTDAGIPQIHAEAEAMAFKEAHEANLDCLATKSDLENFRKELKQEIKDLDKSLRYEIDIKCSTLKKDLIKWVLSIVLAISAAQGTLVVTLTKLIH